MIRIQVAGENRRWLHYVQELQVSVFYDADNKKLMYYGYTPPLGSNSEWEGQADSLLDLCNKYNEEHVADKRNYNPGPGPSGPLEYGERRGNGRGGGDPNFIYEEGF